MKTEIKTYAFNKTLPLEIEVKDLQVVKEKKRLFDCQAKAEFYHLIWLTEGEAAFEIDFQQVKIKAGEIMLISAGQVYRFDTESEYKGKVVLFTSLFFNRTDLDIEFMCTSDIFNPFELNRVVKANCKRLGDILILMENELQKSPDIFQPYITHCYLKIILLEAERWLKEGEGRNDEKSKINIGRYFFSEVEKYFKEKRQIVFYIKHLGVGEKVLNKEVKLLTGKTPKLYVDERVTLEAKRLLSYSLSTIKEISFELGFDEPTNFGKFFKKQTGMTPLEFREKYRKK